MPPNKKQKKARLPGLQSENMRMAAGWRDRLKEAMSRLGLSQRGLGAAANLGPTTVRNVVRDSQDVYLSTLARLSDAMGVSVVWLATGSHSVPAGVGAAADYPADAVAVTVGDNGMAPEGLNAPPPLESIVVAGDVVVYSPSAQADTGKLVVARGPRGTIVRRAVFRDDGRVDLVSNNHLFAKVTVQAKDVLGPAVAVMRRLR